MIGTHISRASAVLLAIGGIALLFGADVLLPRVVVGFPPAATWMGQLLAAGWLAVAALDWTGQSALLGGIYGRPQVMANLALHFVTASTLVRVVGRQDAPALLWAVLVVSAAFSVAYGWLLLRGPFERDFQSQRDSSTRQPPP